MYGVSRIIPRRVGADPGSPGDQGLSRLGGRNRDSAETAGCQAIHIDLRLRNVVLHHGQTGAALILREQADFAGHHLDEKRGADRAVGDSYVVIVGRDGGRQEGVDLAGAYVDQIGVGSGSARKGCEGDFDAPHHRGTRKVSESGRGWGEVRAIDTEDAALRDVGRVAGRILHRGNGGRGSGGVCRRRARRNQQRQGKRRKSSEQGPLGNGRPDTQPPHMTHRSFPLSQTGL